MTSSRAALLVVLLTVFAAASAVAQLDEKFYSQSCPSVEDVVRKEMVRALSLAPSLAGPLLRVHFHDCFVRVRALRVSLSYGAQPRRHCLLPEQRAWP
jgi:peroxidase